MPESRTKSRIIYLTPKEDASMKNEASKLGISVNAFIRLLYRQWIDGIRFEKDKGNNNDK